MLTERKDARHTPGPWRVEDHPTETCHIMGRDGGGGYFVRVADVWATDLPGGAENAALIAAAPALLEALERFYVAGKRADVFTDDLMETARTALAAARGAK